MFTHTQIVDARRIVYTPSAFARNTLMHLQEIGELRALERHTSQRAGLSSCLFLMVLEGQGELTCEGKTWPLSAGDCAFVDCSRPYSHTTGTPLWTLRWIHLDGPTLPAVYRKYRERGGKPVFRPAAGPQASPSLWDQLNALWEDVCQIASSDDHIRDMRINEALNGLLTLLMEQSWDEENRGAVNPKADPVRRYLEEHYAERITLDDLAARFYIDKYYLTRVFKRQFGLSISAYLLRVRVTRAKQLLRFTALSVEEIALRCGFAQAPYFARVFKSVEGLPPSEYRNQWAKKS